MKPVIGKSRLHGFDECSWQAETDPAEGYVNQVGLAERLDRCRMRQPIGAHFVVLENQCTHVFFQI
nr:hypothetical protein [Pseudomonas mohnii]